MQTDLFRAKNIFADIASTRKMIPTKVAYLNELNNIGNYKNIIVNAKLGHVYTFLSSRTQLMRSNLKILKIQNYQQIDKI